MNRFIAALARVLALPFLLAALTVPAIAQDGGYLIRPGDMLRVEVLEDPGLNRSVLVSPDGRITLPLVGGVRASGKTVEAVQGELATRLAPNFATTPNIYVSIERIAERPVGGSGGVKAVPTIDIYVIGEGAKAGKLSVPRHHRAAVLRRDGRLFQVRGNQAYPAAPHRSEDRYRNQLRHQL